MLVPSSVLNKRKRSATGERKSNGQDDRIHRRQPSSVPAAKHTSCNHTVGTKDALTETVGRSTSAPVSGIYLETIMCGIELILSDHALQCADWTTIHSRTIEGSEGYYHLAALLTHPILANLKPKPTQPLLEQALNTHPPDPKFVSTQRLESHSMILRQNKILDPKPSVEVLDRRTVYIEPHLSTFAASPALVALYIKQHHESITKHKNSWSPIQHVWGKDSQGSRGYAFVLMSGNVEMAWEKDRGGPKWKTLWPVDWIVLPKKEWSRRTTEYRQLLFQDRNAKRERQRKSQLLSEGPGNKWNGTRTILSDNSRTAPPEFAIQRNVEDCNLSLGKHSATGEIKLTNRDEVLDDTAGLAYVHMNGGQNKQYVEPVLEPIEQTASNHEQADQSNLAEETSISGAKRRKQRAKAQMKKKKQKLKKSMSAARSEHGDLMDGNKGDQF